MRYVVIPIIILIYLFWSYWSIKDIINTIGLCRDWIGELEWYAFCWAILHLIITSLLIIWACIEYW